MRVVTRKIRSLVKGSEESFGLSEDSPLLDELRELAGVLGVARDAEVLAERYERALDELPTELVRGPVRERLVDGAKLRYRAGLRRSLTAMRSERYFRMLDSLDALRSAEPAATTTGEPPRQTTVESAYRKVRKASKAAQSAKASAEASAAEQDQALHRIRKRAKQLRYTAAATGASGVADGAKTIQTLLGDHQDSVVSRTHLSREAVAAHALGEDTFTYGLLFHQEDELARRSEEQLGAALKKLKRSVRDA
jgi:CHAD domain-containing protein